MPGNRVALLTGTKQVVTFHDTMEWDQFSLFRGYSRRNTLGTNLRGLLYRIHTWINYFFGTRKAAKISTISRYSQGQLLRAFPHVRNKIGYVYHGMPEGFEIDKKNSEFECRIGVLMLGGDSDQKNARNAILAWYQLPEPIKKLHKLKIIGFSGDSDSVINTTIDELKIRNDIEIVGWVSHDEIVSCFQHSAIFLFVSKEEGFGFPLIQAMSTGTPVVTSKADVLLELSGDGAVSAPYDSPASISKAIHSLLVDSTLWTERQEHGLQRAQIFDWRSVSEFFKGVYKDVLKIKGSVE